MADEKDEPIKRDYWLNRCADAYAASTTFIDNNYRRQWEDNIRHHQSKHASGSKYYSEAYKYRSKLFRPKTRSMVRSTEAAAAAAFFTNSDAVDIEPANRKNPQQRFSAELRDGLLNHHLKHNIPWFITLCGGMQDGQVQGCILSKQYWSLIHEEIEIEGRKYRQVLEDKPVVDLLPIERLRIDPAASWVDPINSSPYLILETPMYICDVKDFVERGEWNAVDPRLWHQALVSAEDSTRMARQNGKQDTADMVYTEQLNDYQQVWVRENIMRYKGKDYHFYTLGDVHKLTDPKPLRDVYWHGVRPFSLGRVMIETHTIMGPGGVEVSMPLQKEINEVTNTRQDNVKLVLNKRYIVGRGKQVDLQSLVRNAPGSITLANDVDADVRVLEFNDVTGSSFAEHDRLSVEYDELVGNFSGSSVQSNRKLNETVGGMAMLRGAASGMTQYLISVFSETWVQDVLNQLDKLVQEYETDIELMREIAEERGLFNKYGITSITPELLKQKCFVVVNVTNSATDPMIRLEQFLAAIQKYNEIAQTAPMDMDLGEVRKEIFGKLGYKDGLRFFVDADSDVPMVVQQLQQQVQQLSQIIESKQVEEEAKAATTVKLEEMKLAAGRELEAMRQAGEDRRQREQLATEKAIATEKNITEVRTTKQVEQLKADTTIAVAKIKDNADKRKSVADDRAEANNLRVQAQIDQLFKRIEDMEREELNDE